MYASGSAVLDMTNCTSALMLLLNGTYRLTETKAPDGYMIAVQSYEFIVSNGALELPAGQGSDIRLDHKSQPTDPDPDLYEYETLSVINHRGYEFPSTGGIGTGMFTVLGAVMMLAAGAVLVIRRRTSKAKA